MIISFILSSALVLFLAKKKKYNISDTIDYLLLIYSGGFLSALIIGFIYTRSIIKIGDMYSLPLVSWGGFLGGIIVVIILKFTWKVEILQLLDLLSPGYAIALSAGRIGCFFGGCCYGKHTDSVCGVYFFNSLAPASKMIQPLFPIQLVSSMLLIILAVILVFVFFKSKKPGYTFITLLLLYSIGRFVIEYFRDDSRYFLSGLSDGQCYSLILFSTASILLFRKIRFNFQFTNCDK